jgi:hypothetical protein
MAGEYLLLPASSEENQQDGGIERTLYQARRMGETTTDGLTSQMGGYGRAN